MVLLSILNAYAIKSMGDGIMEDVDHTFEYKPNRNIPNIGLYNTLVKKDRLFLRSSVSASSLVRWEDKNETENWSMSVTFDVPDLDTREVAGIYLYYTDKKTEIGPHNGGMSKFDGYTWGIEFKGKAADVVFVRNDGTEELKDMTEYMTKRDSLNPRRLAGAKELTLKAIATAMNLKLELYSGDKLVYDFFRLANPMEANKPGKYFGIIANYKNASSSKAFVLKDATFYRRDEVGDYSIYKSHTPAVDSNARGAAEIRHGDGDVKELIHKIELVEFLTRKSLGELPDTVIHLARNEILKDLKNFGKKIEEIRDAKVSRSSAGVTKRVNELDIKMSQLKRAILDFDHVLGTMKEDQSSNHAYMQYVVVLVGVIGVLTFAVREIYSKNK